MEHVDWVKLTRKRGFVPKKKKDKQCLSVSGFVWRLKKDHSCSCSEDVASVGQPHSPKGGSS